MFVFELRGKETVLHVLLWHLGFLSLRFTVLRFTHVARSGVCSFFLLYNIPLCDCVTRDLSPLTVVDGAAVGVLAHVSSWGVWLGIYLGFLGCRV